MVSSSSFEIFEIKMKPKNNESNNNTSIKISTYFKRFPKPRLTPTPTILPKDTKSIYVDILKKRLEQKDVEDGTKEEEVEANDMLMDVEDGTIEITPSAANAIDAMDGACCQENQVNQPECSSCKERDIKYEELKKKYLKLTARYTEKDMKYDDLVKTKTLSGQTDANDTVLLDGVFTLNEVKYLRSMRLEKNKDSSFILKCLEFAYKNDLTVLRLRTLKGKPEVILFDEAGEMEQLAKKDPLTPIKVQRINALFIERLTKCKIDSVVYGERIKEANVNRLFASGIRNIVKKL